MTDAPDLIGDLTAILNSKEIIELQHCAAEARPYCLISGGRSVCLSRKAIDALLPALAQSWGETDHIVIVLRTLRYGEKLVRNRGQA